METKMRTLGGVVLVDDCQYAQMGSIYPNVLRLTGSSLPLVMMQPTLHKFRKQLTYIKGTISIAPGICVLQGSK